MLQFLILQSLRTYAALSALVHASPAFHALYTSIGWDRMEIDNKLRSIRERFRLEMKDLMVEMTVTHLETVGRILGTDIEGDPYLSLSTAS